jgi:hypothetical protein
LRKRYKKAFASGQNEASPILRDAEIGHLKYAPIGVIPVSAEPSNEFIQKGAPLQRETRDIFHYDDFRVGLLHQPRHLEHKLVSRILTLLFVCQRGKALAWCATR